jgi:glycogen debranching enzyme
MKKTYLFLVLGFMLSCQSKKTDKEAVIYQSEAFTIYPNKIVQGKNQAVVISPTQIQSNYQSPASATYSRLITFKFSINEKDNELAAGQDHWLVIGEEHESPIIVFGSPVEPKPAPPTTYLPVNYEYTFRVDMSPVIKQFEEKGYYQAYDGSKVAKADFKGFYVAGGSDPLSWDFVNLENKGLKLQDTGKDNIYTLKVKLNPYNTADNQAKEWKLSKDLSAKPKYQSEQPIVDALFNLSLEEALKNIEADSTFRTGAKWGGVWTRDISYSILLAFAYHEPQVAKISLMKKVNRDRIIQDTGSGGAWPVSSDRTTWVLAAWEIYKATGDKQWLEKAYTIIQNTLEDDAKVIGGTLTGMYRGESSFLDWREQTYPKWMSNMDIYVSQNLGTNVVHYQAHIILSEMAKLLGKPHEESLKKAQAIKEAVNQSLWMPEKGFYGQYLYGRPNLTLSPRFEALGEALAVLFEVADEQKTASIFEKSPLTAFGVTCIYPQIPGIPPYHNNAIWPFVQAYWNLAAAKAGNEKALNHGLASIYRASGLFLTNYENMVAETGDFTGTEVNSDRMLWSMAGNLAMVHRVFMGMSFDVNGIRFSPAIPQAYSGTKSLSNFKYRKAVLDITVKGFGNKIEKITIDGKELTNAFFPAETEGKHAIEIEMNNQSFDKKSINLVPNAFSLPNPQVRQENDVLKWDSIPKAAYYLVYKSGRLHEKVLKPDYTINSSEVATYKVSAVDEAAWESFTSEPIIAGMSKSIEIEDFAKPSKLPYTNFLGKGFVEITNETNKVIELKINVEEAGTYWIDFRYSNGSGPWNTDNKCAIRSFWANDMYVGSLVFPQRGKGEWSDWGYSNSYSVPLQKGANVLKLTFEPWNTNMNVDINSAMLDQMRLMKQ